MMPTRKEELWGLCRKYCQLPIIVAGETMADIMEMTSTIGKMLYCGDVKYENDDLFCLGEATGFTGNAAFKIGNGKLKLMSPKETVVSLIKFNCSHWGLKALCNLIRTLDEDIRWWDEIKARNLQDQLNAKLREAVELEEDDESIFEVVEYRMQS